jgi:putative transposase
MQTQLTYRFRLYPTGGTEDKLLETLDSCRLIYNYFLFQWNGKDKIPSRLELQAQLPKLKREKLELNKVHSKVLQMGLYQLYSNLKALSLKQKAHTIHRWVAHSILKLQSHVQ